MHQLGIFGCPSDIEAARRHISHTVFGMVPPRTGMRLAIALTRGGLHAFMRKANAPLVFILLLFSTVMPAQADVGGEELHVFGSVLPIFMVRAFTICLTLAHGRSLY